MLRNLLKKETGCARLLTLQDARDEKLLLNRVVVQLV